MAVVHLKDTRQCVKRVSLMQSMPFRQRFIVFFCFLQIVVTTMLAYWLLSPFRVGPVMIRLPRLSSHTCVGENYHPDSWKYKSCHLRNVCWNGVNFSYHIDPDDIPSVPGPTELSVSVSTLGVTNAPIQWAPYVIPYPLPSDAIWAHNIDDTDLHVLAVEYNGSNFGHVLGDSLLPWWRLFDMFGLLDGDYPFRPIHMIVDPPFTYSCAWQIREKWISDMEFCNRLYRKIAEPFTHRPLVFLQEHYSMATVERPVCFSNLVAGIGMLSDHGQDHSVHGRNTEALDLHLIGGGSILWRFRSTYMERIGMPPNSKPVRGKRDVVFVDRSESHRSWYNTKKAHQVLRDHFVPEGFDVVEPIDFSTLSIREQIEIVSTTKVLLCFPGGSSYISLFLPRGSTLIFIFSFSPLSDGRQDYPLHNNLAHVNVRWLQGEKGEDTGEVFYDVDRLVMEVNHALNHREE